MPYTPIYQDPAPTYRPIFGPGPEKPEEKPSIWRRLQDYQAAQRASFGKTLKSSLLDVTRIPEALLGVQSSVEQAFLPKALEPLSPGARGLSVVNALTPKPLREAQQRATAEAKEAQVAKAEAGLAAGIPDALQVAENFASDFTSMALDPTEFLPGGLAVKGVQALSRGKRARLVVPKSIRLAEEKAGKAIGDMALEEFLEVVPRTDPSHPLPSLEDKTRFLKSRTGPPGISNEPEVTAMGTAEWSRKFVYRNDEGEPIGVLDVILDERGVPESTDVAVAPAAQRRGVASALYDAAEREFGARAMGEAVGAGGYTDAGARFAYSRYGGGASTTPSPSLATALAKTTEPDDVIRAFDEAYFDREIPKASLTDRVVDLGRRVRFELEDEYQPILQMARKTREPEKVAMAEELIQQVRGAPVRSEVPVLRQTMRYDPVADADIPTGHGLLDVMKGHSEESLLDAERLMAAQRNRELAERALAGDPLKVSPESVADSEGLLAALSAKYSGDLSELQGIADGYRDWSRRAFLEPLQGAGVLTEEAVGRMLAKGEQYTLFRRVEQMMEELGIDLKVGEKIPKGREVGGGGPLAGSPIKRIHEGLSEEGKLTGIFESSALQAMRIQRFVDRQHVKNLLGRMADEFPDEVPIRRLPKVQRPVAVVENAEGAAETVFRAQEQGKGFIRYEDGMRIEYDAPGDVLDALGRLTPKQAVAVLAPARFATRLLRAGAVENPAFATFNFLRDVVHSAVYTRGGMIPGYDVARVTGKEVASRLRGKGPTPAWRAAEEYSGFSGLMDVDRQSVRTLQREAGRLGTPGGAAKRFLREWRGNPLLPFQMISSLIERLPRLAEADLIMQGGRKTVMGLPVPGTLGRGGAKPSRRAAGTAAAEVTLNFARGGRAGKSWNRYEAFANAMLQDASKFAREMRQRPFETTVKSMAYIGVPAAVNYALNKDDPEYQEIPEWEKALFYHPGKLPNGWWARIPRPLGLPSVVFGYGLEKILESVGSDDPRQLTQILEGLSATTALQYVTDWRELNINALQPGTEAFFGNYSSFRGRPIVPRSREDYPAREQIGPYTSPSMIGLGNALTTPLSPEGVSPERLQYVYEAHTGTLGREALSLADRGMAALGRPEARRRISSPKDVPILGRFTSKPGKGFSTESVERFYDYAAEADGAYRLLRKDTMRGLPYSNKARLAPAMRQGQQALSTISDRLNQIRDDQSLPEEEKKRQIEALEEKASNLARRLVKLYESRVQ